MAKNTNNKHPKLIRNMWLIFGGIWVFIILFFTFLFIGTTFPDGSVAHDTLECPLADPEGRWLGKRTGRYVDARYRLRGGSARFPMMGHYRFAVTNAMRDSAISGIKDIGLRVEYSGK